MRDRLLRRMLRHRFLVTTDGNESFDGVVTDVSDLYVVLDDVWNVAVRGDRLHLDTALWLPRARIKYMQAVNP